MNHIPARPSGLAYGCFLIAVGLLALVLVRDIRQPRQSAVADPGPRFFPAVLACCLLVGGIGMSARGLLDRFRRPSTTTTSEAHALRLLLFLLGLGVYLWAITALGFFASTLAFATLMMTWLGVRWPLALAVSVGMLALVWVLFVWQFRVVLPLNPWLGNQF